jgi:hypothetical protein
VTIPNVEMLPFFPLLYAETHYTLKGLSLIFRRWPEITADAPFRVEPGTPVPLLLLLRHADRFPVTIRSASARIRYPDGSNDTVRLLPDPVEASSLSWHRLFSITPRQGFAGMISIDVIVDVVRRDGRGKRTVVNHNLPGLRPASLEIRVAADPLPRAAGCCFADMHHHSEYTSDQVEYGAPLEAVAGIAPAMGLSAAAVTDHSYDLDDSPESHRIKDPALARWNAMRNACSRIERESGFAFIPGEELSAGNAAGRNVHLLLLNQAAFVPGSGDSAEVWFKTRPEHSIKSVLDRKEPGALAFAAHPEFRFHFLQRWLLARDKWAAADYSHPGLDGLEILNGPPDQAYLEGLRVWIRLLLEGRRLFLIAGNDAHGGFNRTFQIGLPFLFLRSNRKYRFGKSRTGLLVDGRPTSASVLDALSQGRAFITTGPALVISARNGEGGTARLGGRLGGARFSIDVEAATSAEFGPFELVRLWLGDPAGRREIPWLEIKVPESETAFTRTIELENLKSDVYIRGLAVTRNPRGGTAFCVTNPIWLDKT